MGFPASEEGQAPPELERLGRFERNGDFSPTDVPSDQSSCIEESQDSNNGNEQPRREGHYSSHTGRNGPSFTPPKQRSRYKKKANDYNDDVDERFHGRYLHRQWEAGQHRGVNERNGDFSPIMVSGAQNRLPLRPAKSELSIASRFRFAIVFGRG